MAAGQQWRLLEEFCGCFTLLSTDICILLCGRVFYDFAYKLRGF
jgi:hypothetical protein